ncbi:MAG: hypothetical protein IPP69_18135, partial [Flavobacteriales bacterium]|nr:hypothetical protein [Flavobacteriales bacterium]
MNEWQLQDQLTISWIHNLPIIEGLVFDVVAWELMFPSWKINDNKGKWNEVSVDFILFDRDQTFLCLELKNEIKEQRALLSAYCQTLRTHLFLQQYNPERMRSAHLSCFNKAESYRIQNLNASLVEFNFPSQMEVIPVLAARKFPVGAKGNDSKWSSMS